MTGAQGRLEMLVEPFRESEPGPHVRAAIDAAEEAGLAVEMGPFATEVVGELDAIVGALESILGRSFAAGATSIQLRVETTT